MLNSRPRTPSPVQSPTTNEQNMIIPIDDKPPSTDIVEQPLISDKQPSTVVEELINVPEQIDPSVLSSLSVSIDNGLNELSIERKNDDLLQPTQEDPLDLP